MEFSFIEFQVTSYGIIFIKGLLVLKINSKRYSILAFCIQHIMLGCALSAGMRMNIHDWLKAFKWIIIYTFQCKTL